MINRAIAASAALAAAATTANAANNVTQIERAPIASYLNLLDTPSPTTTNTTPADNPVATPTHALYLGTTDLAPRADSPILPPITNTPIGAVIEAATIIEPFPTNTDNQPTSNARTTPILPLNLNLASL